MTVLTLLIVPLSSRLQSKPLTKFFFSLSLYFIIIVSRSSCIPWGSALCVTLYMPLGLICPKPVVHHTLCAQSRYVPSPLYTIPSVPQFRCVTSPLYTLPFVSQSRCTPYPLCHNPDVSQARCTPYPLGHNPDTQARCAPHPSCHNPHILQ